MARHAHKPQMKFEVAREYFSENGDYLTEPYFTVYDTEAEAEACKARLLAGDNREFHGFVQEDDHLIVRTCWCG